MDKDKLNELADHLETLQDKTAMELNVQTCREDKVPAFCMSKWTHDCDSPACVAGHCVHHFMPRRFRVIVRQPGEGKSLQNEAARILGLDEETSIDLFIPPEKDSTAYDADAIRAARVLRHLASTGEVDR